jgi:hypothetical protein
MSSTVNVQSPEHFSQLLMSTQDAVRHGAMRLLAEGNPSALTFARADQENALAALLGQLESSAAREEDILIVRALDHLDDLRASEELTRVLMYSRAPEALDVAAAALGRWDQNQPTLLRAALHDRHRPEIRALAARHLSTAVLDPAQVLRQALVRLDAGDVDPLQVPSPDHPGMLEPTLSEFKGPYQACIQRVCEAHGVAAFDVLAEHYTRLNLQLRSWMLQWGARLQSLAALNLLDRVLQQSPCDRKETLDALAAVVALGPMARPLEKRVAALAGHHQNSSDTELAEALAAAQRVCERVTA